MSRWNQEKLTQWYEACNTAEAELDTLLDDMTQGEKAGVYKIIRWMDKHYRSQAKGVPGAGYKACGRILLQKAGRVNNG